MRHSLHLKSNGKCSLADDFLISRRLKAMCTYQNIIFLTCVKSLEETPATDDGWAIWHS